MNESTCYLARNVDPPIFSEKTLAQVSQGKWSTAIVDSLDANPSTDVTVPQPMPGYPSTAKAKKE